MVLIVCISKHSDVEVRAGEQGDQHFMTLVHLITLTYLFATT